MISENDATREFTVAVFVVNEGRVLLHRHRKLNRWLPPGGHIEPNELPDEAALREVTEETGVVAELIGPSAIDVDLPDQPRQLARPIGIQLARIAPSHQHIDLVYLARAETIPDTLPAECGWFGPEDWGDLELTDEVAAWCEVAVRGVEQSLSNP